MKLSQQSKHRKSRLPRAVRERAIRAGRAAKAEALARRGATPEDGHKAYRIAYNQVRASWLRAMSPEFRARGLAAAKRWRDAQS